MLLITHRANNLVNLQHEAFYASLNKQGVTSFATMKSKARLPCVMIGMRMFFCCQQSHTDCEAHTIGYINTLITLMILHKHTNLLTYYCGSGESFRVERISEILHNDNLPSSLPACAGCRGAEEQRSRGETLLHDSCCLLVSCVCPFFMLLR